MSKSLFYQFNSCLDMCFRLHFDKHSDKKNHETDNSHIIKSLSAKSNLKDFAHDFAAYIKQEYSVKLIKDITPQMCEGYLQSKYDTCSLKTIKCYQSNLLKLQKCASTAFHIPKLDFSVSIDESKIEKIETIKQYSFTNEEMQKILSAPRQCESLSALRLAYDLGLRVGSLSSIEVRHINFQENTLLVYKDKGNRSRILHFNDDTAKFLRQQIKGKQAQDKLFNVRPGSINTYLRRRVMACSIKNESGQYKTGVHSIRKLAAENFHARNGNDLGKTMKMLGHNEDRKSLEDVYLHSKK